MAVLDVRFDIFLVRFDISRPIRHSVLPAGARVGDALSANSCKISFYSQTYLHP